jgi:hypothetical protein
MQPKVLSHDPKVLLFEKFLDPLECMHIRALARPKLEDASLGDDSSSSTDRELRKSQCSLFVANRQREDPIVRSIASRVAKITGVQGPECCEFLQVNRYGPDGFYAPHFDSPHNGLRVATVVFYLNEIERFDEQEAALQDRLLSDQEIDSIFSSSSSSPSSTHSVDYGGHTVFPLVPADPLAPRHRPHLDLQQGLFDGVPISDFLARFAADRSAKKLASDDILKVCFLFILTSSLPCSFFLIC